MTTESLIATMAKCANDQYEEVHLLLSTPGGGVMNGMNIYNVLRGLPFNLVTHNVGNVDSIGSTIFLAGERRYSCPQSTFMFHGVGVFSQDKSRLEQKELQERLASIGADQNRIGNIFQERTKMSEADVKSLFLEAKTQNAAYAVSTGIVDEIRNVDIPLGSPVFALVFER